MKINVVLLMILYVMGWASAIFATELLGIRWFYWVYLVVEFGLYLPSMALMGLEEGV